MSAHFLCTFITCISESLLQWKCQKFDSKVIFLKSEFRYLFQTNILTVSAVQPVASITPSTVSVRPGGQLRLQCSASGTEPIRYEWSKIYGTLSSATTDDSVLEIDYVTSRDAGRYQCRATNEAGSSDAYADVVIQGKPTWLVAPYLLLFGSVVWRM